LSPKKQQPKAKLIAWFNYLKEYIPIPKSREPERQDFGAYLFHKDPFEM
jgi:hypothetical protein